MKKQEVAENGNTQSTCASWLYLSNEYLVTSHRRRSKHILADVSSRRGDRPVTSTPPSNAAHEHDKMLPICEQLQLQTKLNGRYDFFPLLMFIFSQQEKTVPCFFQRTSAKLSPCLFRAMVAVLHVNISPANI